MDEDVPQPRVETPSQALMLELADQLGITSDMRSRAAILQKALDRISHLSAIFGSISVALKIDQPSDPFEVVYQVKKLQRKLEGF